MQNSSANRWPFALIAALALLINFDIFFGGRTLLLVLHPALNTGIPHGYSGPASSTATTCDPGASFPVDFAFDVYTVKSIVSGHFPFWNPYQGLGQPFFANGLSAILYPVNWLCFLLPRPWWDVVYVMNWLLAAVFTFLYLTFMKFERTAAIAGAVCVLSSGYFQIWLPVREVLSVAAWWPLLLYGIERSLQQRWDWRTHVALAASVYCTITGGQPEVTFLSFLAAAVYALFRTIQAGLPAWRGLLALLPGSVAGILLSAPMWVNFVHYAIFNAFSGHMAGNVIGKDHLAPATLCTYLVPYFYGPMFRTPLAPENFRFDTPGWSPALALFLCLIVLAGVPRKNRGWAAFMSALGILSIAKAWGLPILNSIGGLPVLERLVFFRYVGFLAAFAFAFLTALALDAIGQSRLSLRMSVLIVWSLFVVGISLAGLMPVWSRIAHVSRSDADSVDMLATCAVGIGWCILSPVALWWIDRRCSNARSVIAWVAILGLLLQAAAYRPDGHSPRIMLLRAACCLVLFLAAALLVSILRPRKPGVSLLSALLLLPILPTALTNAFSTDGLPARFDPLTAPPYINTLRALHQNAFYRSYSFGPYPHVNFAATMGISSLNIAEALAPRQTADFIYKFLDRYSSPFWFAGEPQEVPPSAEYWRNKKYFDLIGVRYLVSGDTNPPTTATYGYVGGWIPIKLDKPVEVKILSPVDKLDSIAVPFYAAGPDNSGDSIIEIFAAQGNALGKGTIRGEDTRDYRYATFKFPAITGVLNKEIVIRLSFQPATPQSMIGCFRSDDLPQWGFIFQIDFPNTLMNQIYRDPGTSVCIYENPSALPRVFTAPSAVVTSSWEDAMDRWGESADLSSTAWIEEEPAIASDTTQSRVCGKLLSLSIAPNDIWIEYEAYSQGILVLTDAYDKGWRAGMNGTRVPVLRVNGIFRGIRVPGPGRYKVHFNYRPLYWYVSLFLAGLGVVMLITAALTKWPPPSERPADMSRVCAQFVLAILISLSAATAIAWMLLSDLPPAFDEVDYFMESRRLYQGLFGGQGLIDALWRTPDQHGCLFQVFTAFGMFILSPSVKWAAAGNIICLPVLIVSLYRIGRHIHSRTAGVLAALYGVTTPMMAWMSHHPLEDFALAAFAALALYFLLRSDVFSHQAPSIYFGIACGMAFLAKLSFVAFIYLPVLCATGFAGWRMFKKQAAGTRPPSGARPVLNLAISGVLALALISSWYVPHLSETRELIRQNRADAILEKDVSNLGISVLPVIDGMTYEIMGVLHTILALFGVSWAIRNPKRNISLWLALIGTLLFWSIWPNKDSRYALPAIAVIGPWAGAATASIPWQMLKRMTIAVFAAAMVFLYLGVNFSIPGMPDEKVVSFGGFNWTVYVQRRTWIIGPPRRESWPYDRVLSAMRTVEAPKDPIGRRWVFMTADSAFFGPATLELYGRLSDFPLFAGLMFEVQADMSNFESVIRKADYILECGGFPRSSDRNLQQKTKDFIEAHQEDVQPLGAFDLPNGDVARLYRLHR